MLRFRLLYFLLALFDLSALAVNAQPSPTSATSGIEGVILMSPSRPGPTRKNEPSAEPLANVSFEVHKDDKKIATFTTDAQGKFHIALPPGHYVISRNEPGTNIGNWRFEAEVTSNAPTRVLWKADSGMR